MGLVDEIESYFKKKYNLDIIHLSNNKILMSNESDNLTIEFTYFILTNRCSVRITYNSGEDDYFYSLESYSSFKSISLEKIISTIEREMQRIAAVALAKEI